MEYKPSDQVTCAMIACPRCRGQGWIAGLHEDWPPSAMEDAITVLTREMERFMRELGCEPTMAFEALLRCRTGANSCPPWPPSPRSAE